MCTGPTCIKPPARDCDRTCTQSTLRTTARRWRKLKLFETATDGVRSQEAVPWRCYWVLPVQPPPRSPFDFVYVLPNGDQHQQGWLMMTAACRPTHLHNLQKKPNNTLLEGCLVVESMRWSSRRHHNLTVTQDEKLTRIISLCSRSSQCCTPAGVPKPCFFVVAVVVYVFFFLHI